jgi:muramoyltetrapeptide carboxypeptidase
MRAPQYLKKGDKVAIAFPARFLEKEKIEAAVKKIQEWGLEVVLADNAFSRSHQFAGSDKQRLMAIQKLLDDESIRAIFCARGGYGTVRILYDLNFDGFKNNPKWLIGFSDITYLHLFVNQQLQVETVHAPMPIDYSGENSDKQSLGYLKSLLFGNEVKYTFNPTGKYNKEGTASGILTGGNLSVLYALLGTKTDPDTRQKLLFLEDLDEYLYHVDRMVQSLKHAGKLDNLAGLIVGGLNSMNDNKIPFGPTAPSIIHEAMKHKPYPGCFHFPAGHQKQNYPLILGRRATLEITSGKIGLRFDPAP